MEDYYHNQGYHFDRSFEESYNCFPVSLIEDREYLEDGNRIIMPPSALERLANMQNIEYPIMFEIKKSTTDYSSDHHQQPQPKISHCGVLEFTADDGFVYLPEWMMKNLKLRPGSIVVLKYVKLLGGKFMKIQPHCTSFIQLPDDPKEILEKGLKNFACVTAGDTIMIVHEGKKYYIDVLETNPSNAISLVETDCEVDFAPPLDYKKPEKKPNKKSVVIASQNVQEKEPSISPTKDDHQQPMFRPFSGVARRLKEIEKKPTNSVVFAFNKDESQKVQEKETPSCPTEDDDQVQQPKFRPFTGVARRLDGQPVPTLAMAQDGPAVSRKRAGKLVFGSEEVCNQRSILKKGRIYEGVDNKEKATPINVEEKKFVPFTGRKYTLAD
ncbi:hypothetical protein ACH5RR_002608 [Cinchona calisaya]|uniref:Ubiquitin fusion degradaton protein n=1 Tax=Cinchona calisaya TaxID=153742 RepID=A0ABD3AT20_9GENT